jgi:hypothetical protein
MSAPVDSGPLQVQIWPIWIGADDEVGPVPPAPPTDESADDVAPEWELLLHPTTASIAKTAIAAARIELRKRICVVSFVVGGLDVRCQQRH